jgi:chromosome segregation ATPase
MSKQIISEIEKASTAVEKSVAEQKVRENKINDVNKEKATINEEISKVKQESSKANTEIELLQKSIQKNEKKLEKLDKDLKKVKKEGESVEQAIKTAEGESEKTGKTIEDLKTKIEDQKKNKEIVKAQGPLQDIAGQELHRKLLPLHQVNAPVKEQRDNDPDTAPDQRFFHLHFTSDSNRRKCFVSGRPKISLSGA